MVFSNWKPALSNGTILLFSLNQFFCLEKIELLELAYCFIKPSTMLYLCYPVMIEFILNYYWSAISVFGTFCHGHLTTIKKQNQNFSIPQNFASINKNQNRIIYKVPNLESAIDARDQKPEALHTHYSQCVLDRFQPNHCMPSTWMCSEENTAAIMIR